jgi:hypothetical protein
MTVRRVVVLATLALVALAAPAGAATVTMPLIQRGTPGAKTTPFEVITRRSAPASRRTTKFFRGLLAPRS